MEFAPFFYLELKEHILDVPYTLAKRRIRVLLPKDYEAHPDKHYPVVYMHDGQNVFHSKEAFRNTLGKQFTQSSGIRIYQV